MTYTIHYYSPDVQEQILTLPDGLAGRYVILTKRMEQVGANLHEGIARVFYCTLVGQRIVMLHSFVKKTDKIPPDDLRIAVKRMKEVKNGYF